MSTHYRWLYMGASHYDIIILPCVQVNTNGHISFRSPFLNWIPTLFSFRSIPPLIAPYWEDFDLRKGGNIFYRQTSNPILLQIVRDQVQVSFQSTGNFNPTDLFIVTWDQVPGYSFGTNLVGICACEFISKHFWSVTQDKITTEYVVK